MAERLERQASVVTAPTLTRLSGAVDAVDTAELMNLLGEQITGGSGDGVQLWASPTEDDDVLHVEFMDRTGAHVCLAVMAEGVLAGDD